MRPYSVSASPLQYSTHWAHSSSVFQVGLMVINGSAPISLQRATKSSVFISLKSYPRECGCVSRPKCDSNGALISAGNKPSFQLYSPAKFPPGQRRSLTPISFNKFTTSGRIPWKWFPGINETAPIDTVPSSQKAMESLAFSSFFAVCKNTVFASYSFLSKTISFSS